MRCAALSFACVLASIVAACGSEDRGITEPTPPSEVFVHNTLHRAGDRSSIDLVPSDFSTKYIPMISTLQPWTWDDFTSPVDTTIRTVSWQGGYCRSALSPAPSGAPGPKSFLVSFGSDYNGRPYFPDGLNTFTLTPAEAHEEFAFARTSSDYDCAYHDYTVVLPTAFPVTASKRYWLLIRAGTDDGWWGWRIGLPDNGVSAHGWLNGGIVTDGKDLAFSLSSR